MRTVIAPLPEEVNEALNHLTRTDQQLGRVARGYVARLALQPFLGRLARRGYLADAAARVVYFDRSDRPEDLLERPHAQRRGDQDLTAGPRWRLIYEVLEAPRAEVRVIRLLGVGVGHAAPDETDVYVAAERTLRRLRKETP